MLASRAPINRLVVMQLPYCLPWHDQRLNGISTFRVADSIHASQHRSVVVSRVWGGPVAVWVPGCPVCVRVCGEVPVPVRVRAEAGSGYRESPGGLNPSGLPVRVVRRRATLPHPVECSTIAVPGLSFRVRNGTGRLTWAMTAANLLLYGPRRSSLNRRVAAWEPDSGRECR